MNEKAGIMSLLGENLRNEGYIVFYTVMSGRETEVGGGERTSSVLPMLLFRQQEDMKVEIAGIPCI